MPAEFIVAPAIVDGLTTDPEASLLDAVQRRLDRPVTVQQHDSGGVLVSYGDDRAWHVARLQPGVFANWEAAASWMRDPTQPARSQQQCVDARHDCLAHVLGAFFTQPDALIDNATSARRSAHSSTLLWWHDRVRAGVTGEAAWLLLSLQLPSQHLGDFTFDAGAGTLVCVDACATILDT